MIKKALKECTCREVKHCSNCPFYSLYDVCMSVKLDEPLTKALEMEIPKKRLSKVKYGLERKNF